jgi:hypothetical protein
MPAAKKKAAAPKGAVASRAKKSPPKDQNPTRDASPKVRVRDDPDTVISSEIGEVLEAELKKRRVSIAKSECGTVAFTLILHFLRSRAAAWSRERPIRQIGDPDAEVLGVASSVLKVVSSKSSEYGIDFDKAVGEWTKDEVAAFLAIGFIAITNQRVQSLENNIRADDIPF